MSRGRKPTPSPEEIQLWEHLTRSVAPLRHRTKKAETPPPAEAPAQPKRPATTPRLPQPARARPEPARPPPLSPIDRRTVSRLGRGTLAIDARIDLHGMTQAAAHRRLVGFLRDAQASGARLVLVITGKGRGDSEERGVLRRAVPVWLSSAELRPLVVGFDEAGRAHGGAGALYVRLRRARRRED